MIQAVADFLSSREPFVPSRWLGNGHAMTVYTWARRRHFSSMPSPDVRLFRVAHDSQVMAHCYWQRTRIGVPTLLALHGLEGSSDAHYMRGLAAKAWSRGWNAVLLNQRNCGGTEHLTPALYHSGLTGDPKTVVRELAHEGIGPFGLVGYSLGGNLAVKLSAELGPDTDLPVHAVVAISPTIDLERCVRAIERRSNVVYQFNFVRNLRARMRRKAQCWPGLYDLTPLGSIWTIRKFDDVYTAPSHGFKGAAHYYASESALKIVDRIATPTLIVAAEDDPFVPPSQFRESAVIANPSIAVCLERHGGHCGFATTPGDSDGYWAEDTAVRFLASVMQDGLRARRADRGTPSRTPVPCPLPRV
jgi:predicted alpha/beta-fold hydrolase